MKILVLGCRGFIGSYLITFLSSKGHEIAGCDLGKFAPKNYSYYAVSASSPDFDEVFSADQFDLCINAAGIGNVSFSVTNPLQDFEANTAVVAKVLDTIRRLSPQCKYLHISSAAVYGNPLRLPVKETDALNPVSPYGFHKLMAEMLCKEYFQLYNLKVAVLRPFSVFGPGLKKQLLWDISEKLQKKSVISLFGTGNESRDFIHIHDLAALIEIIANKSNFENNIYNAASGKETSIKEIASIFEQHFPGAESISFSGEGKKGDPVNWVADISLTRSMGFIPTTDLAHAVKDYIKDYKSGTR